VRGHLPALSHVEITEGISGALRRGNRVVAALRTCVVQHELAFEERYRGCLKVCNIEQTTPCGFAMLHSSSGQKGTLPGNSLPTRATAGFLWRCGVLLSPRGVESHRFFFLEQIIGLAQQCRHVHVEAIPTGRGRTYLFVWAGDDTKESYTRGPAGNFRETRAKSRIKCSCEFHPCGPGMKSLDISGVREG
jgi:hypothetical protein